MKDKKARLMLHALASRLRLKIDFGNMFSGAICEPIEYSSKAEEQGWAKESINVYICENGHLHKAPGCRRYKK